MAGMNASVMNACYNSVHACMVHEPWPSSKREPTHKPALDTGTRHLDSPARLPAVLLWHPHRQGRSRSCTLACMAREPPPYASESGLLTLRYDTHTKSDTMHSALLFLLRLVLSLPLHSQTLPLNPLQTMQLLRGCINLALNTL